MPRAKQDRIPLDDPIADNLYELFVVWSELVDSERLSLSERGAAQKVASACHKSAMVRLDAWGNSRRNRR